MKASALALFAAVAQSISAAPLSTKELVSIATRHGMPMPPGAGRLVLAHTESWSMLGNQSTSRDPGKDDELLSVSDALEKLAAQDKQKAELAKLRYLVGLTTEEAAEVLGISVPTADRWWNYSRAWLFEEIEREQKN